MANPVYLRQILSGRLALRWELVAAAAVALAGWIGFRLYTGIRLEDALITYRYASHLAQGHGFVFNIGERVLGTTTPLLTLVLGAIGAFAGVDRIPLASNLLMMVAWAGAGAMTIRALQAVGFTTGLALFTTSVLLLNPEMLWMATGGMETPLVLLCMAGSLWALATRRHRSAAAFAGLLVLTRVDGGVWATGVLACIIWQDRSVRRRSLTPFVVLLAPWVVFAFFYFGSPIPHTVIAKQTIGHDYDITSRAHLYEYLEWIAPFFAFAFPFVRSLGYAAFATGAVSIVRRPSPAAMRLLLVFPLVLAAAFYVGRAPLGFDRYLAPIGFASLIVGIIGVRCALEPLAALMRSRRWLSLVAGAAITVYVSLLGVQDRQAADFERRHQINEEGTRRVIGEWLRDHTPADAVVAMEAVGYQAFYSNRKVIDLAGLVSPAVVEMRRNSHSNAETFHRVLVDLRPDFLVLRSFEVDRNAHFHGGPLFETDSQAAYFSGHYAEVRRFEAPLPDLWGEGCCLTIYRRTPGPAPAR